MAYFFACQCSFTLTLLILIAASPIQTHARDSNFFSKVTRSEPQTLTPKPKNAEPKPETLNPEPEKALPEAEPKTQQAYGLFGKDEAYQYAPTTTNPTKSDPNGAYAGEKQGMSDTRFLENGRYYYDINSEKEAVTNSEKPKEEEEDGHESYYGQGYESGNQYREPSRYETGEKQGNLYREPARYETGEEQGNVYREPARYRTGKRQWNGQYFEDIEAEKRNSDRYSNNVEFYGSDKYRNQFQGTVEKQGMSDTRFLENGRYFHDIRGEGNGAESYQGDSYGTEGEKKEEGNGADAYQGESYDSNYEEEDEVSEGKQGSDFRATPNKFPEHEFDSMEEYEKYVERKNQKQYLP